MSKRFVLEYNILGFCFIFFPNRYLRRYRLSGENTAQSCFYYFGKFSVLKRLFPFENILIFPEAAIVFRYCNWCGTSLNSERAAPEVRNIEQAIFAAAIFDLCTVDDK